MPNESINPPYTANHGLSPKLLWMNNSRIRLEFKGSCLKQDKVTCVVNFIVYETDRWSKDLNTDFTIKDCLFGAVKISKNADPDKYSCLGYGSGFDSRSI